MERVLGVGRPGVNAGRGCVQFGGKLHLESLVRAFVVELVNQVAEAGLREPRGRSSPLELPRLTAYRFIALVVYGRSRGWRWIRWQTCRPDKAILNVVAPGLPRTSDASKPCRSLEAGAFAKECGP